MARDPLSVAYDTRARRVLLAAVQSHRDGGMGVTVFLPSPPREFRHLDRGGRTRHERQFQNALYYPVFSLPRQARELPQWSLKVTWGKITYHRGRWGRPARVRLYRYSAGYRHASQHPRWSAGEMFRSVPGARVDQ